MAQRNLILVYQSECLDRADFEQIAKTVRARAPDIEVFIVEDVSAELQMVFLSSLKPSLIFSPVALQHFIPARGRIFCGRRMSKLVQMQLMRQIGVPVPDWAVIKPESRFKSAEWGHVVVVKPTGALLASYARGIDLQLTEEVSYHPPASYPADHPGHYGAMFVQRFIDTGPHPSKIRVLTLFGTPLYAEELRSEDPQTVPVSPTKEQLQNVQITVVNGPRTRRFVFDPDVFDLARRVYQAAPFIALQGADFIREATTGKLYALEFNPGGNIWHFSSKAGGHHRIDGKQRQDQFNAFELAADALIKQTRSSAL